MSRLLKVKSVEPLAVGHLRIAWDDGVIREVDVSAWMTRHPLLVMLNSPEVFRDVRVVEWGSGIEWVNGADFCAQALRRLSDEQLPSKNKVSA